LVVVAASNRVPKRRIAGEHSWNSRTHFDLSEWFNQVQQHNTLM